MFWVEMIVFYDLSMFIGHLACAFMHLRSSGCQMDGLAWLVVHGMDPCIILDPFVINPSDGVIACDF